MYCEATNIIVCQGIIFGKYYKAAPTVFGWTTLRRLWHIMTAGGSHPTLRSSLILWTRMWTIPWSRPLSRWNWSLNICLTRNDTFDPRKYRIEMIVRPIAGNNYLINYYFYREVEQVWLLTFGNICNVYKLINKKTKYF